MNYPSSGPPYALFVWPGLRHVFWKSWPYCQFRSWSFEQVRYRGFFFVWEVSWGGWLVGVVLFVVLFVASVSCDVKWYVKNYDLWYRFFGPRKIVPISREYNIHTTEFFFFPCYCWMGFISLGRFCAACSDAHCWAVKSFDSSQQYTWGIFVYDYLIWSVL